MIRGQEAGGHLRLTAATISLLMMKQASKENKLRKVQIIQKLLILLIIINRKINLRIDIMRWVPSFHSDQFFKAK